MVGSRWKKGSWKREYIGCEGERAMQFVKVVGRKINRRRKPKVKQILTLSTGFECS